MQERMIDFIRALRAAGVRISLAESQEAMFGVDETGVRHADTFKSTMKATLVKNQRDQPVFEYFFPIFFKNNRPPLQNILEQMAEDEQALLRDAMRCGGWPAGGADERSLTHSQLVPAPARCTTRSAAG